MKKIAVLFGGVSSEYGVSLVSAHAVMQAIDRTRYDVLPIGIFPDGRWMLYSGSLADIPTDKWRDDEAFLTPCTLSADRLVHGLVTFYADGRYETIYLDAVFPVLHGKNGEDGTVQGLITLAGIPLVGCGVLASALCMDKYRAHLLAGVGGIRVPFSARFGPTEREEAIAAAKESRLPLFIKPIKAGSSYGITKVRQASEIPAAVALAYEYDDEIVMEEAIEGFEVGCAVMGDADRGELTVGRVDEIEIPGGFFDFTEKYTLKSSKIHMPARVDADTEARIRQTAVKLYNILGCRGFARVDMFLTPDGEVVFNEINTIPGFTSHSRFPGMMRGIGLDFTAVVNMAIDMAIASGLGEETMEVQNV